MDETLSEHAFDEAVARLRRIASNDIGIDQIEAADRTILMTIECRNSGRKYHLRIKCGEAFPGKAPEYLFVNPDTGEDDDASYWPDDGQESFKTKETPRWICTRGTSAYSSRHSEYQYNARLDTIGQTVFHIMRRINGRGACGEYQYQSAG